MLRSEEYLDHVRARPCCYCTAPGPSDPHHYRGVKGTGCKPSDLFTVPLCRRCHDNFHRNGKIGASTRSETIAIFDAAAVLLLAGYLEKLIGKTKA